MLGDSIALIFLPVPRNSHVLPSSFVPLVQCELGPAQRFQPAREFRRVVRRCHGGCAPLERRRFSPRVDVPRPGTTSAGRPMPAKLFFERKPANKKQRAVAGSTP
jgi:hypothetical protein